MESKSDYVIAVFFTHAVSLALWEQRGMLSREVKFYQKLAHRIGEVWFFTYGFNDSKYQNRLGDRVRLFPKRLPLPHLLYGIFLPIIYWKQMCRADVIRIHQMAGAIPALMAHWLFRKPLIVRCGYQWSRFVQRQHAPTIKQWIVRWIEALAYRAAKVIVVATHGDREYVSQCYKIPAEKIYVIPNFVDTELFKPFTAEKEPKTLCFVGRLEPQKNLHSLVEAMQGVNAKLVLYGEGSQRASLEQAAREYGINMEFRGRISNEDLPRVLNACEVFILPSLYEGNPKVLLEAMACGAPVIGANVEGIRELIKNGQNGLLCDTNATSIRSAIEQLLGDRNLRQRLGTSARQTILDHHSLTSTINMEYELFLSTAR